MDQYITKLADTDTYLLDSLSIEQIIAVRCVSGSVNRVVSKLDIYDELIQLNHSEGILLQCYQKGLLKILKLMHTKNRIIYEDDLIVEAAINGHVHVIKWFIIDIKQTLTTKEILDMVAKGKDNVIDWFRSDVRIEKTEYCPSSKKLMD